MVILRQLGNFKSSVRLRSVVQEKVWGKNRITYSFLKWSCGICAFLLKIHSQVFMLMLLHSNNQRRKKM